MKKETFDKILDELITEAVGECNMEETVDNESDVTFSKEHTDKMKKLFGEAERRERLDRIFSISKKVAVIIIVGTVVIAAFTPKISAWKKVIKEFFIKEENKYSWIVFNEPEKVDSFETGLNNYDDSGEGEEEIKISDFLGYVPEGFEVEKVENHTTGIIITLKEDAKEIRLKISKNNASKALDAEYDESQRIEIDGKYIYNISKNDIITYAWEFQGYMYRIRGANIEVNLIIKFIENINYEKINNIF